MENPNKQNDIRCGQCHKKLAEGTYIALSIKCRHCKTINQYRAESPKPERQSPPHAGGGERPGNTGQHGQAPSVCGLTPRPESHGLMNRSCERYCGSLLSSDQR